VTIQDISRYLPQKYKLKASGTPTPLPDTKISLVSKKVEKAVEILAETRKALKLSPSAGKETLKTALNVKTIQKKKLSGLTA
jgi:hypothetical protein